MKTYFILEPSRQLIKIGRSTNVPSRFASLQTANGGPLALLGTVDGDREAELHSRFANARTIGEWFRITPELAKALREDFGLTVRARARDTIIRPPSQRLQLTMAAELFIGLPLQEPDVTRYEDHIHEAVFEVVLRGGDGEDCEPGDDLTDDERDEIDDWLDEEADDEAFALIDQLSRTVRRYRQFWIGWAFNRTPVWRDFWLVFWRPTNVYAEGDLRDRLMDAAFATEADFTEPCRIRPVYLSIAGGVQEITNEIY